MACAVLQSLTIVSNLILLLVYILVTAYFSPALSLILLAAALCDFGLSMLSRGKITSCSAAVNRQMKEDNKVLSECVDAIELAKQNDVTEYLYKRCQSGTRNFIRKATKSDAMMIFLGNLNDAFNQVVSFAVSAFLIMTMQGSGAGDLVYCLFVSGSVLGISQTIENAVYMLMKNSASFDNVAEVSQLKALDGEAVLNAIETITFEDVDFSYSEGGRKILDGTSFTLRRGDIVCLKGANGRGKSTVFKLMTRLLTVDGGKILMNGIPIESIDKKSLDRQICYIGQDEALLNGSIENYLEVISGGPVSRQKACSMQEAVKLDPSVQSISDNGNALSGGQKKKLLMMKLLMRCEASSVILIDELEAGLDTETQQILSELEREIIRSNGDKIIVKISHIGKGDIFTGERSF